VTRERGVATAGHCGGFPGFAKARSPLARSSRRLGTADTTGSRRTQ
jgi:hypothetical protein